MWIKFEKEKVAINSNRKQHFKKRSLLYIIEKERDMHRIRKQNKRKTGTVKTVAIALGIFSSMPMVDAWAQDIGEHGMGPRTVEARAPRKKEEILKQTERLLRELQTERQLQHDWSKIKPKNKTAVGKVQQLIQNLVDLGLLKARYRQVKPGRAPDKAMGGGTRKGIRALHDLLVKRGLLKKSDLKVKPEGAAEINHYREKNFDRATLAAVIRLAEEEKAKPAEVVDEASGAGAIVPRRRAEAEAEARLTAAYAAALKKVDELQTLLEIDYPGDEELKGFKATRDGINESWEEKKEQILVTSLEETYKQMKKFEQRKEEEAAGTGRLRLRKEYALAYQEIEKLQRELEKKWRHDEKVIGFRLRKLDIVDRWVAKKKQSIVNNLKALLEEMKKFKQEKEKAEQTRGQLLAEIADLQRKADSLEPRIAAVKRKGVRGQLEVQHEGMNERLQHARLAIDAGNYHAAGTSRKYDGAGKSIAAARFLYKQIEKNLKQEAAEAPKPEPVTPEPEVHGPNVVDVPIGPLKLAVLRQAEKRAVFRGAPTKCSVDVSITCDEPENHATPAEVLRSPDTLVIYTMIREHRSGNVWIVLPDTAPSDLLANSQVQNVGRLMGDGVYVYLKGGKIVDALTEVSGIRPTRVGSYTKEGRKYTIEIDVDEYTQYFETVKTGKELLRSSASRILGTRTLALTLRPANNVALDDGDRLLLSGLKIFPGGDIVKRVVPKKP